MTSVGGASGGQTREHLFKECATWKKEIRQRWEGVASTVGTREAPARTRPDAPSLEEQERIWISCQTGGRQAQKYVGARPTEQWEV